MDEFDKIELTDEVKTQLREQQTNLIRLVEALAGLEGKKEWGVLKELIFDKSLQVIERQILSEALTQKIDVDKLYRLQGEWAWAKQYSDTDKFAENLKRQLASIKNKLK